jgi:MFS family permease
MISACTAAVQNPTGAILARFFLGAAESVLYPGALYYISGWYTRKEMQLRVTLMNAGNLAAQDFGVSLQPVFWEIWMLNVESGLGGSCSSSRVYLLFSLPCWLFPSFQIIHRQQNGRQRKRRQLLISVLLTMLESLMTRAQIRASFTGSSLLSWTQRSGFWHLRTMLLLWVYLSGKCLL